ncbi:unnamed protein product [Ectocarpus sp. 12 AP-2014]
MGFFNYFAGMAAIAMVTYSHATTANNVSLDLSPSGPLLVISPGAVCADWGAWVSPQSGPVLVMQVVSKGYIDVECNFIYWMELKTSFTRNDLYLLCLDDHSIHFFESSMGIRCVPLSGFKASSHAEIWVLRVRVLNCLVEAGHDVIMSDADALWLADPMKHFSLPGVIDSSIVASRGSYPRELGDVWGATMCMGFILFRATARRSAMMKFVTAMDALMLEMKDDQMAVNIAARDFGIVWKKDSDMRYEESTGFGMGFIESLSDEDNRPLAVALLPHSAYTRICASTPVSNTTVVAHCRSSKTPEGKVDWMRHIDLWAVDKDNR